METRNGDNWESTELFRIGKFAILSMIVLAWVAAGALIILEECDVNRSFAAAWRAPTLTTFWIVLGGIVLCFVTIAVAVAIMPSKPQTTRSFRT